MTRTHNEVKGMFTLVVGEQKLCHVGGAASPRPRSGYRQWCRQVDSNLSQQGGVVAGGLGAAGIQGHAAHGTQVLKQGGAEKACVQRGVGVPVLSARVWGGNHLSRGIGVFCFQGNI